MYLNAKIIIKTTNAIHFTIYFMKLYEFLQDLDRKGTLSVLALHGIVIPKAQIIIEVCATPHKNRRKFMRERRISRWSYYRALYLGNMEL